MSPKSCYFFSVTLWRAQSGRSRSFQPPAGYPLGVDAAVHAARARARSPTSGARQTSGARISGRPPKSSRMSSSVGRKL